MKSVIHKFVLERSRQHIRLEPEAVVMYADRDSRSENPAIWVRRCYPMNPTTSLRTFRVVATGEPFEYAPGFRACGLVRMGELIFHVFEEPMQSPIDEKDLNRPSLAQVG